MTQSIPLPKSSASITYEQLGYLESFDAVVDKLYAFLIYNEIRPDSGKYIVKIKGSVTAGTAFDPNNKSLENAMQKAQAHGAAYIIWGFNLTPKDGDPRLVENRLYFNDELKPTHIEIHIITRDANGEALPEKIVNIAWPGTESATASDEGLNEFKDFYMKYERACRNKNGEFLKKILPPDIPADEFEFVLNMSQQSSLAIDASGIDPTYSQKGNVMEVLYEGDLGDDITSLTLDFYFHNSQWLKYNPEQ